MFIIAYSLILCSDSTYNAALLECLDGWKEKVLYVSLGGHTDKLKKILDSNMNARENTDILYLPLSSTASHLPGKLRSRLSDYSAQILQTATELATRILVIDNYAILLAMYPRDVVLGFVNDLASWRPSPEHQKYALHNSDQDTSNESAQFISDLKLFMDHIIDRRI